MILLHLTGNNGKYSCCYCEAFRLSQGVWIENAKWRTIEEIIKNYEDWEITTNKNKDKVKDFFNCAGKPLVDPKLGNVDHTFVFDYLCLPSLHLVLGPFNKLWKELEILEPRINDVALGLNCVREEYFGKTFEGNETNKLLNNTDKLREVTDESLHIFIECMEGLLKVKQSCFGFALEESYKKI